MELSEGIAGRKRRLSVELDDAIGRSGAHARLNHRLSIALMVIALGCSLGAAVGGVFFGLSGPKTGALAAMPPVIAFAAVNLRFEGKSSWHYRKKDALSKLRSRLEYRLAASPSIEDVGKVSDERDALGEAMQKEWDATLLLTWSGLLKGQQ